MKDFREHFYLLYNKLKNNENFAFSRFSDGELFIMQNKELILADNYYQIGDGKSAGNYFPEDHKHFNPRTDGFYKDKLLEAYKFLKHNYYVGLSCRCCVGDADFKQMLNWYEGDPESEFLTWSNLWVNGNFPLFRKYVIPEFSNHKIVYIVNENAYVEGLPFKVSKVFRIGHNCFINDYDLIKEVKEWIDDNNIKNHVFLFSASSLSNLMIHQLFEHNSNNTYIDIGTTLNDFLKMKGLRGYLRGASTLKKICIW